MFRYFNIIVHLFIVFLQALVYWYAYESCFVASVQASTISLAWVSDWTMMDYLFAAGWQLFKHLLLSACESGTVHCSFHYFISTLYLNLVILIRSDSRGNKVFPIGKVTADPP